MSKPTYEQLEQERNELAAQVERLRDVLANFYDYVHCERMSTDGAVNYSTSTINHHAFMALNAIHETPPAALAALKAQWQAEAVRDFEAMLSSFPVTAEDWIEQRAQEAGDE